MSKNYFLKIMDDVAEGILEKKSILSFFLVKYNSISVVFYGRFISNIFFKKTPEEKNLKNLAKFLFINSQ